MKTKNLQMEMEMVQLGGIKSTQKAKDTLSVWLFCALPKCIITW